jgi:parvulin-like peptidyl-prolyl isomerase
MSNTGTTRPGRRRWRWFALGALGVAGVVAGWYGFRNNGLTRAGAQPAGAAAQTAAPAAAAEDDDEHRVVAYLYEREAVTRDELGEYLIARRGPEKLDAVVNRRIIDMDCKNRGVTVSAAEVEAALGESIKGLNIGRERFVKDYLKGIHKSLFEWKEDVLRPKLMLTKICRGRVQVSEDEVKKAFESKYGEKVECRIIIWPVKNQQEQDQVLFQYAQLRDSEEAFAEAAKKQAASALAATGGKVKPIGRFTLSEQAVENAIFKLRAGEVSELIPSQDKFPKNVTIAKCDRRIPAETTASLEAKHDELMAEVAERKLQAEIGRYINESRALAQIKPVHENWEDMEKMLEQPGQPGQVLVTIHGNVAITRQDLREFLITRYGAESLDLLLNRKIIDRACQAKGITVSTAEVDAAFAAELERVKATEKTFVKDFLYPNGKTLFEFKEDFLRPKLMMTKVAREQTKVTDEDLRMAFDALYGERIKGRLILWKTDEKRFALTEYSKLRDDPAAFETAARRQFNSALAAKGGEVPPFARHTTGIDRLEEEAFKLQPGEVSSLIDLPEGCALFKCEARLPATTNVKMDDVKVREELQKKTLDRKTEASIPVVFEDLRKKANPKSLLKNPNAPEDLAASVQHDLGTAAPSPAPAPAPPPPPYPR